MRPLYHPLRLRYATPASCPLTGPPRRDSAGVSSQGKRSSPEGTDPCDLPASYPRRLLVVTGLTPARAADLAKLDRGLKDEPKYATAAPKYCLLAFGPEAKTVVWLVLDGDTLHVRASPDGKSAPAWREFKNARYGAPIGDVWEEGGKARYEQLRYSPGQDDRTLSVRIDGKVQSAGWTPAANSPSPPAPRTRRSSTSAGR